MSLSDEQLAGLRPSLNEYTPEQALWCEVMAVLLNDLATCQRLLIKRLLPEKAKALARQVLYGDPIVGEGKQYWQNRHGIFENERTIRDMKQRLQKLKHEIDHHWFECICDFAGLDHKFMREACYKILDGSIGYDALKNYEAASKLFSPQAKRYLTIQKKW